MIDLFPDNSTLKKYTVNVIGEVEGEVELVDKLRGEISAMEHYIDSLIGYDKELSKSEIEYARRATAYEAMANAIPALDLVLTANGFGVVSSTNIAPASKDRTERLIRSYHQRAFDELCTLSSALSRSRDWWSYHRVNICEPVYESRYIAKIESISEMRSLTESIIPKAGRQFEDYVAQEHIGVQTVSLIRDAFIAYSCNENISRDRENLARLFRALEVDYIKKVIADAATVPCGADVDMKSLFFEMERNEDVYNAYCEYINSFPSTLQKKKGAFYF